MRFIKPFCLAFIFILFTNISMGQSLIIKFSENYRLAGADAIGNFYLVNDGHIVKIDSTGKELFSYADPESGSISFIDVSDPFRVLVYYKSYNQLSFLDRTLSPLGEAIALDEMDIFKPVGIAKSSLGGVWMIDSQTSSLLFIDHNLKPALTIKISGLDDGNPDPWYPLVEWKGRLYLCDPGKQIKQFDLFGTQLKIIPSETRGFTKLDGKLLLVGPGEVQSINNMPGLIPEKLELDLPDWEELHISGNHALLKQQSSWSLFRLKKTF